MSVKLTGFAGLVLAAGLLAACEGPAARAPATGAVEGAELAGIETSCRDNLVTKIPNPQAAKIEALVAVEWREYASGLKTAVFSRLSGQTLGQMEKTSDQALTGGEASTAKTWRIKLKAKTFDGKDTTVPAWCRSLKTTPNDCVCETSLRTE